MKNIKLIQCLLLATLSVCAVKTAFSCTDIRVNATDGTILITRTLEFAEDLQSNLRSSPRERTFHMTAPNGKPGMSWNNQYGYLYLDAFNHDIAMDGMNEQGLAFEYLYLPNFTQYQTVTEGQENKAISYLNFGDWVLGNFKSVDELKAALPSIFVYSQPMQIAGNSMVLPVHAAVHDASGKSIVIEFVNGKLNVYDNPLGVMTNSPTYDWQLTNLNNYVNLTPITPKPIFVDGLKFIATGQGAGMKGLPGDISPPSRFVKMSWMLKTVLPATNATSALNISQHIINNVDIPLGFVREPDNGKISNENTQWTVFKDLTHKAFYYRTYNDTSLHLVNLSKVNFSENSPALKMSLSQTQAVNDISDEFIKNLESSATIK